MKRWRPCIFVVLLAVAAGSVFLVFARRGREVELAQYLQEHGPALALSSPPTKRQWNPRSTSIIKSKCIVLHELERVTPGQTPNPGVCLIYCSDPFFRAYLPQVLSGEVAPNGSFTFAMGHPVEVIAVEVLADGKHGRVRSFNAPFVEMGRRQLDVTR